MSTALHPTRLTLVVSVVTAIYTSERISQHGLLAIHLSVAREEGVDV